MVPVPSYQIIEFLEWLSRRHIRIGQRDVNWDNIHNLASQFLEGEGLSLFAGTGQRPSLEFFMRVFQTCPMIGEPTVSEQMSHFAGCGQCPSHMRRHEGRRSSSVLHPLLRGFLEYAHQSGFDEWVARETSSFPLRTEDELRQADEDHIFRRMIQAIGRPLEREFTNYVHERATPGLVADYENFRRRSEGHDDRDRFPFPRMPEAREEGTEPITERESPRDAAYRLVDSVQQLVSGGYYDQYLATNHELCRWLSLTTERPEDLIQSLEFLAWLSKTHPGLDIVGDVPNSKVREFVFMFCEAVGYSNAPSFAATVEKWMRGEGTARSLSRIWDFIRRTRRTRGRRSDDASPFQRYKTVKLHAMFLFLSSGDFPSFIEEHWEDLNALTGDHVDIYYSREDLKRRVSGYETLAEFKTLKVAVTDLPALILWSDSLADARSVPLGSLPPDDIVAVMKTVVAAVIDGKQLPEIAEAAHDEAQGRIRRIEVAGGEYVETKIIINGGDNIMRDKFEVAGQAGAVGPNAHAHDMTFNQLWNATSQDIDLAKLASELATLREGMRKQEKSAEHALAIGEIAGAEIAAKRGDGPTVLQHLKKAGKWALSCAEKIGVGLAVVALKKAIGI